MHAGLLKLVMTSSDGSEALVAFRGPDTFVGEYSAIDGLPRLATAVVVAETTVTPIDRHELLEVLRSDPDLALALLVNLARDVRATAVHVLGLASADPLARVARRLVDLVSDPTFASVRRVTSESVIIDMPVSQHDLARWAGVSHRSVGASLQRLRNDGQISTGRLRLEVHDVAGLSERAEPTEP